MKKPLSFISRYKKRSLVLANDIGVSIAYDPNAPGKPPKIDHFKAIWDTGATNSIITKKIVEMLELEPSGIVTIIGVNGKMKRKSFFINFYLPNHVMLPGVKVTECDDLSGNFNILIGMDVIGIGDFAVSNYKNKTSFTFRVPSIEELNFTDGL
jgi:hypothetical protein